MLSQRNLNARQHCNSHKHKDIGRLKVEVKEWKQKSHSLASITRELEMETRPQGILPGLEGIISYDKGFASS